MTSLARHLRVLCAAAWCLVTAESALAQTYTWNRDASDSWNTASNWNPAVIPNSQGVSVVFGNVITADRTVTLGSPVTVGSLTFQDTAFSYLLTGSTLMLDNGASPASITMASTVGAHQRIDVPVTALSDVTITNDSTSWRLLLLSGMNLGNHTLTVNGAGTVTVGSTAGLTGSGGLVVYNGTGELRLTGSNSGVKFVVNNGTLVAGFNALSAGSFTPDLVTINNNAILRFENGQVANAGIVLGTGGGRLEVLDDTTISFPGVISGSTTLTKMGTGTLVLAGTNAYTGDTVIRNGTLRVDASVANNSAGPLGNANSAIVVGDNVGANSTALLVSGSTAVTIGRDITVAVSAAPGTSSVTIGTHSFAAGAAFTGTLTLNRSVTLRASGSSGTEVSFGRITGTGDVTIAGDQTTRFTSSASDFVGTITIGTDAVGSGRLSINSDAQMGAASNSLFLIGGTLRVTGSTPFSTSRAISLGHVNGVVPSTTARV